VPSRKTPSRRWVATKRTKTRSLTQALLEPADDMRRVGVLDAAGHEKTMLRHLGSEVGAIKPLTGDEIRTLRKRAHQSQALTARCPGPAATGKADQPAQAADNRWRTIQALTE
jgi:hypothetical protein